MTFPVAFVCFHTFFTFILIPLRAKEKEIDLKDIQYFY